jgi:hypothetical protein
MLLNVIEDFSGWIGMEVKVSKSCGMWLGVERDQRLPLNLSFREQQLKIISKDNPARYLGFFQSPDGDWEDMVRRVLEEIRKTSDKLECHPLTFVTSCGTRARTTFCSPHMWETGSTLVRWRFCGGPPLVILRGLCTMTTWQDR